MGGTNGKRGGGGTYPLELRRGSVRVIIYRQRKAGRDYFRVVWYEGSQRKERLVNDPGKARREADSVLASLARADHLGAGFSGRERVIYQRALDAVAPFGVEVDAACIEWAAAKRDLGERSINEAAVYFMRHHGPAVEQRTVEEAVAEFRAEKETAGLSVSYLADIDYRLGALSEAFTCPVASVTPEALHEWLNGRGLSPRGFNNFRAILSGFFAFCRKRRYLPKEADPLARVEKRKLKASPIAVFTPDEAAALLEAASDDFRPCLAVQLFAGCRAEEVLRLEWNDLTRAPGYIEIGAHKAKTASRRLVPVEANLTQWLAFAPRRTGRFWPHSKPFFFEAQRDAAQAAGVEWKRNAARHSFISYRLALVNDAAKVALEAGNSPQMIFRCYRELVTPEQARTWFAIAPRRPESVTAFDPKEAAA